MFSKKYRFLFLLCLLVLFSLSCGDFLLFLSDTIRLDEGPHSITLEGEGTHTWAWNDGEQTCDTEDDMVMTITSESVTLRSEGKCMSIQGLNPYTCYETEDGGRCGITITGKFDDSTNMSFDSCSTGEPASGTATYYVNGITSGTARCGYETFTFTLSKNP